MTSCSLLDTGRSPIYTSNYYVVNGRMQSFYSGSILYCKDFGTWILSRYGCDMISCLEIRNANTTLDQISKLDSTPYDVDFLEQCLQPTF